MRDGRGPGRPGRIIPRPPHPFPSPPIRQRSKCDNPVLHPQFLENRRWLQLSPISLLLGLAQLPV